MPDSASVLKAEIVVVGAGVLGLCAAVGLTLRGHDVRVVDPGHPNASSVAAGMIAPALEAVLDDVTPRRAALFRAARTAWNSFAAMSDIRINPAPTLWAGGNSVGMTTALAMLGFDAAEVVGDDGKLSLVSDVLVEPGPALATMRARLRHPVFQAHVGTIERMADGWRLTTDSGDLEGLTVVLATGAAREIGGLPGPVASLLAEVMPIRGQIGRAEGLQVDLVTRGHGIYAAPSGEGVVIGATMEPGRRDLIPDMEASEALKTSGESLLGRQIDGPIDWRVGIRGATSDGLPMAGPSGEAGLFLALAPRRNGWLLGPLVARVVADAIERGLQVGGATSPYAADLDPRRFAIR